jgi:hypothetical protein
MAKSLEDFANLKEIHEKGLPDLAGLLIDED